MEGVEVEEGLMSLGVLDMYVLRSQLWKLRGRVSILYNAGNYTAALMRGWWVGRLPSCV